jgi:Rieske Fe-S protein
MLAGLSRRMWAQTADATIKYAPLTRPVRIPLDVVAEPWHPSPFVAEARAPATPNTPPRRVLVTGVLFRTGVGHLSALCLTCPHEQCQVDLVTDSAHLARMTGRLTQEPLFECACHFSVFDAARDGAKVSGETPRGLYRFRVTEIVGGVAEINEIEEVALFEV